MTNTYVWTFNPLETIPSQDGLTDIITTVHWQFTGTNTADTSITARMIGTETLGNPNTETFIDFNNITHENVKTWVLNKMVEGSEMTIEEKEQSMKDNIDSEIDKVINPPIVKRTPPWE